LAECPKCLAEYIARNLVTLLGLAYGIVLSNSVAAKGEDETTFSFKDSTVANLHDDIDVDGLVIELKLLKNLSTSFVLCTFETVRDVSKALTPALRRISGVLHDSYGCAWQSQCQMIQ